MSTNIEPFNTNDSESKSIEEQLEQIKQMRFRFGCLGINCLGWIIIFIIFLLIYLFTK